jgi:hypothetical protein
MTLEARRRIEEKFPFLAGKGWTNARYMGKDSVVVFLLGSSHSYISQAVYAFNNNGEFLGEGWL